MIHLFILDTEEKTTSITLYNYMSQTMRKALIIGQNPILSLYYQSKGRRVLKKKEVKTRVMKKMETIKKRRQRRVCMTLIVTMN